jgi:hypothetical protein
LNKLFYSLAAASVLSLSACTAAPLPTAPDAAAAADVLALSLVDQVFYRAFAQNAFESPNRLEPVRRLPGPLRIYLRTADDAGRAIDRETLETIERVLIESAPVWSGGQFGVTEVARGTGTREKVGGWLTIKWAGTNTSDRCGRSTVGIDGGYIEFNDLGACSCGAGSRIYPRLVRHELGHAMGYYHTGDIGDVMYGQAVAAEACDLQPSERERRHARIFYAQSP